MIEIIRKYNFWNGQEIKFGYPRDEYINKLSAFLNNNLIKVLLGQRRTGKSYILRMLISQLIKQHGVKPENILYINKDLHELDFLNNSKILQELIGGVPSWGARQDL